MGQTGTAKPSVIARRIKRGQTAQDYRIIYDIPNPARTEDETLMTALTGTKVGGPDIDADRGDDASCSGYRKNDSDISYRDQDLPTRLGAIPGGKVYRSLASRSTNFGGGSLGIG